MHYKGKPQRLIKALMDARLIDYTDGRYVIHDWDELRKSRHFALQKGKDHWNWKGGITPERMKVRRSRAYSDWRRAVFSRDGYVCQQCGQHGGKLNAHHIERFADNTSRRLDVNNGITLCEKCHKEVHRKGKV